jgi:hypothetical protein
MPRRTRSEPTRARPSTAPGLTFRNLAPRTAAQPARLNMAVKRLTWADSPRHLPFGAILLGATDRQRVRVSQSLRGVPTLLLIDARWSWHGAWASAKA